MSMALARRKAEQLIESSGIFAPPIPVDKLAESLKIEVVYAELGQDVSGLLISNSLSVTICIQHTDHHNRQRFTLAHELGHYCLGHQFEPGAHVHVDRGNYVSQRNHRAAEGIDPKEIEANQFAACLLMPAKFIARDINSVGPVLLDRHVSELARKYDVSEPAMTNRLTTLRYI